MKRIVRMAAVVLAALVWAGEARGTKHQYRSVGPGTTAALASGGTGNTLQINSTYATFSSPLADRIGVGDVLVYDSSNDGILDKIAFIRERIDAYTYTIQDTVSAEPEPVYSPTIHWVIHRAYTSLNNAVSGAENAAIDTILRDFDLWIGGCDLVAQDEIWHIACYGDNPDMVPVAINGWTTDADHYLRIFTPALPGEAGKQQRHRGLWDSTAYALTVADNTCLLASINHLRLEGLQFRITSLSNVSRAHVRLDNSQTAEYFISGCLFAGSATAWDNHTGITILNTGSPAKVKVWNNLFYGFKPNSGNWVAAVNLNSDALNAFVYNNTFCDNDIGLFQGNGYVTAINNLAQACGDGYQGTFTPSSDYNLSDLDGDAPGVHAQNLAVVDFVNSAGLDYHLASTDTAARDRGVNLSADANLAFNSDLDNETRPADWDIGADEYNPTPTALPTLEPSPSPTSTPDPALLTPSATPTPTATPTLTADATAGMFTATLTVTLTAEPSPPGSIPGRIQLRGNVLNEQHKRMGIVIRLDRAEHVRVRVYSQRGRREAVLLDEVRGPGLVETVWAGTDQEGRPVASGIYLLHIQAESFGEKHKIAVVR